ncbi:MAG: hypothetical protein ACXW18_02105 [Pyrinomonadaceae bacterium]
MFTNQIIYGSNIIIRNLTELATLSVFYEKTLLPYASKESSRKLAGLNTLIQLPDEVAGKKLGNPLFDEWSETFSVLFEEGVLDRLPPPPKSYESDTLLQKLEFSERLSLFTRVPTQFRFEIDSKIPGKPMFAASLIPQDLVLHFLRTDLSVPQVFIANSTSPSREFLVACEAKAVFSYLLPALNDLEPDQILEVRHKVKDTREGFSMHLQKLSKGIEERSKGNESSSEIEKWAKSVSETELIPDYREFRRQLSSKRSTRWANILDKARKVFEIDASPVTPKFYGELLTALGLAALTSSAASEDKLSNQSQAFQFMRVVEDSISDN